MQKNILLLLMVTLSNVYAGQEKIKTIRFTNTTNDAVKVTFIKNEMREKTEIGTFTIKPKTNHDFDMLASAVPFYKVTNTEGKKSQEHCILFDTEVITITNESFM